MILINAKPKVVYEIQSFGYGLLVILINAKHMTIVIVKAIDVILMNLNIMQD